MHFFLFLIWTIIWIISLYFWLYYSTSSNNGQPEVFDSSVFKKEEQKSCDENDLFNGLLMEYEILTNWVPLDEADRKRKEECKKIHCILLNERKRQLFQEHENEKTKKDCLMKEGQTDSEEKQVLVHLLNTIIIECFSTFGINLLLQWIIFLLSVYNK